MCLNPNPGPVSAMGNIGQWAVFLKVILAGSLGDYTVWVPYPCTSEDAVAPWTSEPMQSAGQGIQGFHRTTQLATNKAGCETQSSHHRRLLRPEPGEEEWAWLEVRDPDSARPVGLVAQRRLQGCLTL